MFNMKIFIYMMKEEINKKKKILFNGFFNKRQIKINNNKIKIF
jgi:hypothetical protein